LRGATRVNWLVRSLSRFQSTLPLRGATRPTRRRWCLGRISIHTPLAGSDHTSCRVSSTPKYFNPHSPCGERPKRARSRRPQPYFNPHSPCGERLLLHGGIWTGITISIHTPLAGSDVTDTAAAEHGRISIHTPLAGSDKCGTGSSWTCRNFNPHSPCGERRASGPSTTVSVLFQSTLPLRGATTKSSEFFSVRIISIHTPLAGSDRRRRRIPAVPVYFNPHSPCGERL